MSDAPRGRDVTAPSNRWRGLLRAGVFRLLRHVPPRIIRALPWRGVRRPLLHWLNGALYEYPRSFTAKTRYGFRMRGQTRDLVQRFIYVFGVWEPDVSQFVHAFLRPGDVVVDVGANVGYYTLLSGRAVGPTGSVIAVEPVPTIMDRLSENVRLNDLHNVTKRQAIAAAARGTAEIFRAPSDNLGRSSTHSGPGYESEGTVETVPAYELVSPDEWSRVRLVKVDTEGDEYSVLLGLEPILSAMPIGSAVLAELSPNGLQEGKPSAETVIRLMSDKGFIPWLLHNDYEVDSYVDQVPRELDRLVGAPSRLADVLFIKEARESNSAGRATNPANAVYSG